MEIVLLQTILLFALQHTNSHYTGIVSFQSSAIVHFQSCYVQPNVRQIFSQKK